jgi:hypothetical protein
MKNVPISSKTDLTILKKKLQKLYKFSCQKAKIRIRIPYDYTGSGSDLAKIRPDPDPQHLPVLLIFLQNHLV